MIYLELTESMFTQEFHRCDRGDQFTHEALCAMYDYLDSTGEDLQLDVIGLCRSFCEYTIEELEQEEHLDEDNVAFEVRDYKGELISYVVHFYNKVRGWGVNLLEQRNAWREQFEAGAALGSHILNEYKENRESELWRASRQIEKMCEYIIYLEGVKDERFRGMQDKAS